MCMLSILHWYVCVAFSVTISFIVVMNCRTPNTKRNMLISCGTKIRKPNDNIMFLIFQYQKCSHGHL